MAELIKLHQRLRCRRHRSMARVVWRSSWTGAVGRGSPVPVALAVVWRDHANQEHPDFRHWIEPA